VVDLPNPSPKVFKYAGTFGVSEPASMMAAGRAAGNGGLGELVVPKVKANMLTLAVSRVPFGAEGRHG
jgi:cobalamin biosynthesis protein CbiG